MLAIGVLGLATPRPSLARSCPDELPKTASARRALAKELFSDGQAAQARGDEVAAVKAYACSFRIVPHAFTAYNLAKSAEKTGDLEQALQSYRNYLTLAPEAKERPEVELRIRELEARAARLQEPVEVRPQPVAPPVAAGPTVASTAPPATPAPVPAATPMIQAAAPPPRGRSHVVAGAATLGGGALALAGAIVFNVLGRQKMTDCRNLWYSEMSAAADAACADARPLAYTSYALFGVAGAAAVGAAALFLWDRHGPATPVVALAPRTDGGTLLLSGAF